MKNAVGVIENVCVDACSDYHCNCHVFQADRLRIKLQDSTGSKQAPDKARGELRRPKAGKTSPASVCGRAAESAG